MIGILAGMGPKSTAPFIEKVVSICQLRYGAKHDMDFPPMMIYSCPTPFYLDRPLDHAAMEAAIVAGTKKLAAAGVDCIAIPCNTAHVYLDAIRQSVGIPVLDMVAETLKCLPSGQGKITVLATQATLEAAIYQKGIVGCGKEFVFRPSWQTAVNGVLAAIKSGATHEQSLSVWDGLCEDIRRAGAAAIIACTDLNAIIDCASARITLVDSSVCLASALVDRHYQSSV